MAGTVKLGEGEELKHGVNAGRNKWTIVTEQSSEINPCVDKCAIIYNGSKTTQWGGDKHILNIFSIIWEREINLNLCFTPFVKK